MTKARVANRKKYVAFKLSSSPCKKYNGQIETKISIGARLKLTKSTGAKLKLNQ